MADAEHSTVLANYQTPCALVNFPWCLAELPHDATPDIVERRVYDITASTRTQMQTAAITYARQVNSLREIMLSIGLPSRLHVVRTTAQMFDTAFAAQYENYMQPHADYH